MEKGLKKWAIIRDGKSTRDDLPIISLNKYVEDLRNQEYTIYDERVKK